MARIEKKLALLAFVGLFAAGNAAALPMPFEPETAYDYEAVNLEVVNLGMGTSGEGPDMESVLQGMSFVDSDLVVMSLTLPVQPVVTGCDAATACQTATAVPEPGTWLLLITGLLGLRLIQRKNG